MAMETPLPFWRPAAVAGWDRYELLELLGQGGMGRVYKARDPRLNRLLVLKFIRGDAEELAGRFLREAQAQGRVRHENVCEIYDTGQVGDQLYIAMQHIEGRSLSSIFSTLSIEEKAKAIIGAARGLHAAHRLGIIHRDVKPSNIMMESREDGSWHPYVVDFGLARQSDADGLTSSGAVVGTVQYVAPEQALGDVHRLDRRTDVYSLGITLYEILCGKLPFEGSSAVDVIVNLMHQDPPPMNSIDPAIPRDLETIVLKCLEKEQHRRYDSAAELADDLERFLNGDPIRARRPSLAYRIGRSVRKNRRSAAVLATVILVSAGIAGYAINHERRMERQAALSARFGTEVQYIEDVILHAKTSSLHNISADRRKALRQLEVLRREIHEGGDIARGPGAWAMGAALLALGRNDEATASIQRAWDMGYRTSQVAYSLGTALGRQYEVRARELDRIIDPQEKAQIKRTLEENLRTPALRLLDQSRGVKSESADYLEALIAYYDGRYEESLERIDAALARYPWIYQAKVLRANIARARANEYVETGDHDRAMAEFFAASRAYEEALVTGQSDASVYVDLCSVEVEAMTYELHSRADNLRPFLDRAVAACDKALLIDPSNSDAYVKKSAAYSRLANWQYKKSERFEQTTVEACAAADKAVAMDPENENAHYFRSFAYFWRSTSPVYSADQRLRFAEEAASSAREMIRLNPSLPQAYGSLGNAYLAQHNAMAPVGGDPREVLGRAMAAYRSAMKLNPKIWTHYNNIANAYDHLGNYERLIGVDADREYLTAATWAERGAANAPGGASPPFIVANSYELLAEASLEKNEDPSFAAPNVERWLARAIPLAPNDHEPIFVRALMLLTDADWRRQHGGVTVRDETEILKWVRQGVALNDSSLLTFETQLRVALWRAEATSKSPAARLHIVDEALGQSKQALDRYPESAELQALVSSLWARRAELRGQTAEKRRARINSRTHLERAERINPLIGCRYRTVPRAWRFRTK